MNSPIHSYNPDGGRTHALIKLISPSWLRPTASGAFGTRFIHRLACCLLAIVLWQPVEAAPEAGVLRSVVIVSRHGVRTPNQSPEKLAVYAAQPWATWKEPPGYLTAHGRELMVLMGSYYRARYQEAGLLSGRSEEDAAQVYLRAHNIQRCMETARALAAGCLGEVPVEVHTLPATEPDPLFATVAAHVGHPDHAMVEAAVFGRVGGDLVRFAQAYRRQFGEMAEVLFGRPDGVLPKGKMALLDLPVSLAEGEGGKLLNSNGPIAVASELVEDFLLEYVDGQPVVGWGRMTRERLADCYILHSLRFDLMQRTFYLAQVEASNLAAHLSRSFEQTATGRPVAGAFAPLGTRLVIEVGHDGNIANLAGLLGLSWSIDGLPNNPTLPGGALVFELWQHPSDQRFFMRAYYVAQTLDQMRAIQPLTTQAPPAIAPLFIPGCSGAASDFEAPLEQVQNLLRRVIDPSFVTP